MLPPDLHPAPADRSPRFEARKKAFGMVSDAEFLKARALFQIPAAKPLSIDRLADDLESALSERIRQGGRPKSWEPPLASPSPV